jgi:hypothetical protein
VTALHEIDVPNSKRIEGVSGGWPGSPDPSRSDLDFGPGNDTFNHNVPITWP